MTQAQPRDLPVSVVTGAAKNKLFRVSPSTWFVCQLVGSARFDMVVDGEMETIDLAEGEAKVLPAGIPHRWSRAPGAAALMCELDRGEGEEIFESRCERCLCVVDDCSSDASVNPAFVGQDDPQDLCDDCD